LFVDVTSVYLLYTTLWGSLICGFRITLRLLKKRKEKEYKVKHMNRKLFALLLTLFLIASIVPLTFAQNGPEIDKLRFHVIKSPDAELIAMQTCDIDVLTDLIRTGDIEKLYSEDFTITSAPGFHMGHIGFNIRPNQTYKDTAHGSPIAGPVLSDANFRHACFHCYNQDEIVASVYKYIVTPVRSLVPPAQGGWGNPAIPTHPYNPGDPEADTIYNPETQDNSDACSILRYGGYEYDGDEWIVPYDLDGNPATNDTIPELKVFTPTYEVAPTSAEHGNRFVADCNAIGIPLEHDPREFSPYLDLVFGAEDVAGGEFDLYMVFWGLGRFPDHLYDMCHSDYDSLIVPDSYNSPGIHSDELDDEVEIIKFSLNHTAKMAAAYKAQVMLYDPDNYPECACAYMQLYSRILFNAFKPGMRGVVNSPGYGSDNSWTFLNMRWTSGHPNERIEDGDSTIVWCLGEEPESFNPCYASTVYAWEIIGTCLDGLMAVNPYTHADIGWMATSWKIDELTNETVTLDSPWYLGYNDTAEERILYKDTGETEFIPEGMKVTFTLRDDVEWQCGNIYTPSDAEFNLEFFRNNKIPRYMSMWEHLVDVQKNETSIFVYVNRTSQFLIYDFAGLAAYLPPPVWTPLDGRPLQEILAYNPSHDTTKPTGAGDDWGVGEGPATRLYGTGPFVFEHYDAVGMYSEHHANRDYFLTTQEIRDLKTAMFHVIGDVDSDAQIWGSDKTDYGLAYGTLGPPKQTPADPGYDPNADLNSDGEVDAIDGILISWYWGDKKEYP